MAGRFSIYFLDEHAAPKLGNLTACGMPPMDEPPNYIGTHILNSVFVVNWKDDVRRTILMFLRRAIHAVREYRAAREHIEGYVEKLPTQNSHFLRALRAVDHLEQCVGATCQAVALIRLIHGQLQPESVPLRIEVAERLKKIWNRAKHFDEDLESGKLGVGDIAAPVWITNEGLETSKTKVTFAELHGLITDLIEDSKILADDLPQKISKEFAAEQNST